MIATDKLLASIPQQLRDPLVDEYRGLSRAYNEGRWKLAALDAGRFCEVAYTVIHGLLSGKFAAAPQKPGNFVAACRALESMAPVSVGDRSLRILIPRLLPAMYEIRNNRNVGHVGGDVVPNNMDAALVREGAGWVVAELVRISHQVSVHEAQDAVDALVERKHPLVWEIDGVKRVLDPQLRAAERALILLYSTPGWVGVSSLKAWVRYQGDFPSRVLRPLFDRGLIELQGERVTINPLGIKFVEVELIPKNV